MRPRRSQLKSPARARSARARLQAGAAARMFSQPSPGSSQKALEKTHEKLTKRSSSKRPASARSMFSQPSPGSSQKAPNKNARETHETFQLQTPGERAQRASKGCTRPTTLAILMLAMLSPRWLRCASWCFALVLLAIVCASLLVFSVACDACGSRFSRASRSSIARFLLGGKIAPRAPQERPRGAKRRQESAKRRRRELQEAPRAAKRRQGSSGTDSRTILDRF